MTPAYVPWPTQVITTQKDGYNAGRSYIHRLETLPDADAWLKALTLQVCCCSVLQSFAVWCSVLQYAAVSGSVSECVLVWCCDSPRRRRLASGPCSSGVLLQGVAVCCSALQIDAVRLQSVAECRGVLLCVVVCYSVLLRLCSTLMCGSRPSLFRCGGAVCCSVLQYVVVCCRVLQCVAVCCSVLQRVAVCCSLLQCAVETVLDTDA